MNYLDLVGTILSLIGTFYFIKADIKMWPVYILAILVNSILYFQYKMYASLVLENMYLVVSIYGWFFWKKTMKQNSAIIGRIENYQFIGLSILWFAMVLGIYYLMINFTDTSFPVIEAIAVSTSIISQILSSRKIIECWYTWIIADSVFIYLMISQELYFHGILFSCYLVLAIIGLLNWIRLRNINILNKEQQFT